jgi:biotin operon repressor
MDQAERDRLVALKKAKKKLITQKQAAEEIGVTERQVRRLLRKLRQKGDRAVIHELRGRASNRKLPAKLEQRAMTVLVRPRVPGIWPDAGGGILAQTTPDYGEQGDRAAMDDEGGAVASRASSCDGDSSVETAAEPLWRTGAVGHSRA